MKGYYYKQVRFYSQNRDWHNRYLSSTEDRITSLLRFDFGNDFWQKYSDVLIDYFMKDKLLFRAKSVIDSSISLDQLWSSKGDYQDFLIQALGTVDMVSVLNKNGLSVVEKESDINLNQAQELVQSIQSRNHIVQFKSRHLQIATHGPIGDPLKLGKGYLPFPDET